MIARWRRLEIPELIVLEAESFRDARGFFTEIYRRSEFSRVGIAEDFVQDNYSHSTRNVLRGLHYQKAPKAQAKLVTVLRGEIFDVAVDLRRGSPSYARWTSVRLSSAKPEMLYVPVGFAHGFCVLSEEADVLYKVSEYYAPESACGIIWNDPALAIGWPVSQPTVSVQDAALPPLNKADKEFVYESEPCERFS
jgi:dTDP-4-dehydrorhamnose 3,5-epimerase